MSGSGLERVVLRWAFSRGRWVNAVLVVGTIGLFFALAPGATMELLRIRPSGEVAALFRLYGIILACRGLLHHATFGIAERRLMLGVLASDIAFALPSALVLTLAIRAGLAGATAWAVVGLFCVEGGLELAAFAGLRTATREELLEARARRGA